jgi:hypothetical protein
MKSEIGRLKETKPDSPHTEMYERLCIPHVLGANYHVQLQACDVQLGYQQGEPQEQVDIGL